MSTSLFFDYPCKRDGSEEREVVTELAWCKSENLLACALESGRVAIYQDEVSFSTEEETMLECGRSFLLRDH